MGRTKASSKEGLAGNVSRERGKPNNGKGPNSEFKKRKREKPNSSDARPSKKNKTDKAPSDESPLEEEETHQHESGNKSPTTPSTTASTNVPPPYGTITTTHDVLQMYIISSSQIEKKVTSALNHLSIFPAIPPSKPALVMLHSKSKTASKMISIVEIAKREITAGGGKWFQYNIIDQIIEPRKELKGPRGKAVTGQSEKAKKALDVDVPEDAGSDEDEDAFETMKTPFERAIEGKPKIRTVPTMTTYLSRVRIESLGRKYGEQTNGLEALDRGSSS